jgi:glycosyltransferase involved in cell wall biosynthesis
MTAPRLKVAVLVNMIAPSRIPVYSGLSAPFDLLVLHGGTESNRDSWRDLDRTLPNARIVQAWGWQIPIARKHKGQVFDKQYMHITPGYIWHLLKFRPDALISNEMGLRTLIALAYGTMFSKPVWVWWGGTSHTERKIGFARKCLRKLVSHWATRWISYGQSSTEYLLSLGISRERLLQIQNAVDEQRFTQPAEPELQLHPRPVLLYVGQFIVRKGVELLLNAAAAVQAKGQQFSLLLVGSGRDEPILERRVKDLGLSNVHFERSLPPDRMPSIYRSGDVLVFPTLEDPWGLVVNEAMLSGLPVLCSKHAGCAEELLGSDDIFDPENPEEFARKLEQAVSGQLSKPDLSRLKTMSQVVDQLIRDLEHYAHKPFRRLPATSPGLPIQR